MTTTTTSRTAAFKSFYSFAPDDPQAQHKDDLAFLCRWPILLKRRNDIAHMAMIVSRFRFGGGMCNRKTPLQKSHLWLIKQIDWQKVRVE